MGVSLAAHVFLLNKNFEIRFQVDTNMLRLRFGGSHLAIALFTLNAIALYYLYSLNNLDQGHFWFSRNGPAEKQQQPRIDQAHIAMSQAEAHRNHDQSKVPNPITTVFITPKPKTTTFTKSATATVTSVSRKTVTLTQTRTQTVEITAKPTSAAEKGSLKFCQVCGPHDVYCQQYGCVEWLIIFSDQKFSCHHREHNLARSRVYEGSNSRFRRVLRKALSGEPIKIGVLGGSVTKGHGLTNYAYNWTVKLLQQLRKLLPVTQIELVNGAVPATGSDYYSMCFGEHIPDDVDIVIIELAVNDQR